MSFGGKRAVVFGGAGFLGSHVASALTARGADVLVVDRVSPRPALLAAVEARIADVLDSEAVRRAVHEADHVFAFAARAGAGDSVSDPLGDLEGSCRTQLVLLEAVRQVAPEASVVFPGSRLEYGKPSYLPVDEAHTTRGDTPYAIHKTACAAYYRFYAERHGLRTCVLRLSNPYGPHAAEGAFKGFGIVNHFVDVAVRGGTIELFGGGPQLRDLPYVEDVAEAILAAALRAPAGCVLNVGSGEGVSLADAARTVVDAAGSGSIRSVPWPEEYLSAETGDFYFDISAAREVLGWSPRTPLTEGLARTVAAARKEGEQAS
ncbi:MAG TPA: NAD-dependent epimerase/dehydratase family protein [Coriobacteriia bacterium]|jgi:UDP-glucose 4-epimerase